MVYPKGERGILKSSRSGLPISLSYQRRPALAKIIVWSVWGEDCLRQ